MKKFSPLAYIRKFQYVIVAVSLLAGIAFYIVFAALQNYTVSAIIEYTNAEAVEGKSPDGMDIDTSEIYSVPVMQEVFRRMGLEYDDYNLDQFRSRVVVTPVQTEEEVAIQEAQNDQGEESELKPTKYMVSFTASREDAKHPDDFARQVLDNMLEAFLSEYAKNHCNGSSVVNNVSKLKEGNYDYLEMVEIIEENVDSVTQSLGKRAQASGNGSIYRSAHTGYSFGDIYREFGIIGETEVPNIFAYILNNKVSMDRDVLISKYVKRIADYNIANDSSVTRIEAIDHIINSYVRMMRESGNTDITYEYILNDVEDDYYRSLEAEAETGTGWVKPDETVKYDVLLEDYVSNREAFENTKIEIAYCNYIIDVFSGASDTADVIEIPIAADTDQVSAVSSEDGGVPADADNPEPAGENEQGTGRAGADDTDIPEAAGAGEEAESAEPAVQSLSIPVEAVPEEEAVAAVDAMLTDLIDRLDHLYTILEETNTEYNEYIGAANISLNSNIVQTDEVMLILYTGIVIVVCAVFFSIAIIVAGRLADIFNHYAYVDRKFSLPNRVACDRYMSRYADKILPENMSCISINITNVRQINQRYGVSACDDMLRKLIKIMETAFSGIEDCFVSVNGLGQFVVFAKETSYQQAEACMHYITKMAEDFNQSADCPITFSYAVAESHQDSIYSIKALMMKAIERCSGAAKETEKPARPSSEDILARLESILNNK